MRDTVLVLRSFAPSLIKFPTLGLAAAMVFFFGGSPQTQHANSTTSGITSFDAPGAGTTANALQGTSAFGINATGATVGLETDSTGVHHGVVRGVDGTITEFDAPDAGTNTDGGTLALGIDAGGDVTGFYKDSRLAYHGYVRSASGTITEFDVPGASTNSSNDGTNAFAINAGGDVTGYYTDTQMTSFHGFVRAANGTFSTFDAPGAGSSQQSQGTRPVGINAAGEVTGFDKDSKSVFHGFIRAADGTITVFDAPGAGTATFEGTIPIAIDAAGDTTGTYVDAKGTAHGFLRSAGGTFAVFDAPGAGTGMLQGTLPLGINSTGVIVGADFDSTYVLHGFQRAANGTLTTIDAPGAGTGADVSGNERSFQGTSAFGINDSGDIAGSYLDSSSISHGYVLAAAGVAPPSFQVSATAVSVSRGATSGNTSTITVTPGNFTGAVTLTAAITTSPAGAQDPPTLSFGSTSPVSITGANAGTATLTISTTAATTAALAHPHLRELRWYGAGSAVLACILFFGVPFRSRGRVKLLSLLLFFAAICGGIVGCGGSGGGSTGTSNPGTTPGNYVVTVTGTSGGTTASGTVALTVQ